MKQRTLFAIATVSAFLVAGASGANVILNGGFESGTGSDADSWNEINGNPPNPLIGLSGIAPASGLGHARLSYDNLTNPPVGGALILQQVGTPGSIDDSLLYNLSFSAMVDNTDFTGVNFQVGLFLGGDAVLDTGSGPFVSLNPGLTTSYQTFTFTNLSPGTATDLYDIQFLGAFGAVANIVNALNIDNVTLSPVPEPSVALLGGLGLLALLRRKR